MKTARVCCFALGTALLLAALFLVLHNISEDKKSGRQAERILAELKDEIPEFSSEPEDVLMTEEKYDLFAEYEKPAAEEMKTIEIDGALYIGYITIPELGTELPVMNSWSYEDLKKSPCRYSGNISDNDLVIAAHNYRSHFGRINELDNGDEIVFTDVTGKTYHFTVINVESIPGTAVEEMQSGASDEWDLTLFTCTLSGQSRVTIRAERTED